MTTALVPDIEKLTRSYLIAHSAVTALNTQIVGQTPGSTSGSWVRVTELGSPSVGLPDHLIEFMLQLDCYASKDGLAGSQQKEATLNARTIRAALADMSGAYADGTVSGVKILGSLRMPDTDLEKARERVILTALVWAHA